MRLIDAEPFDVFSCQKKCGDFDDGVKFVLEALDEAPTIDAVPVVWSC